MSQHGKYFVIGRFNLILTTKLQLIISDQADGLSPIALSA